MKSERQSLIDTALAMNASGLNPDTSGNLSRRVEGGLLITPSALPYDLLEPNDIVFLGMDGSAEGRHRPSSEWRIHRDIYRARPDIGAVVHAHPPHATALACLHFAIPDFHYEVAFAGGDNIRCADYATFGTEALSENVLLALDDRFAALMANHGLVALGADPAAALRLAQRVEELARVYCLCLSIREPQLLGEQEMRRVLEKFRDYGSLKD